MAYSLNLYSNVLDTSQGYLAALRRDARDYRRSIRARGGFWQASFYLEGEAGPLADAFYTWLGGHLVEKYAGVTTWEGLIYEVELSIGGNTRRRSLDTLANAVKATYQNDGEIAQTAFNTVAQSITRYGRKEIQLLLDNYPLATAQAYRDTYLAEYGQPRAQVTGLGPSGPARLYVMACGYIFTANWLLSTEAAGTSQNVSNWISSLAGTAYGLTSNHGGSTSGAGDCEYLKTGTIETNTLQVVETIEGEARPWDLIAELAELGDSSSNPWVSWVGADRLLHYRQLDTDPRYYLRGGGLYDQLSDRSVVEPWGIRPAVVRDMSYSVARAEPGSFLSDARDIWIEEVEVYGDGQLSLKVGGMAESDILEAQYRAYQKPEPE